MAFTDTSEDWRSCFARLGPRLLLFARQWLPNVADAEDAVQEAFVRFWRRGYGLPEGNAGLLFAAVRSAALDHLRREGRRQRREQAALDENVLPTLATVDSSLFELRTGDGSPTPDGPFLLEDALRRLPAEQREVLVLKIWGELTYAEVGDALSISANTAASRYRYALCGLRKLLHPTCHE